MKENTEKAFFALLRAGLWEKDVSLASFGDVDFSELLQLSEEQSVVGLVAAGLEHVTDTRPEKKDKLQFIGRVAQLEQRNQAMNYFIGVLVDKMRADEIFTLLVKGQGVAQCYERPLWRACGDVDFFLDADYEKAKTFLTPLAASVEPEGKASKHFGMTIDPWVVELHGTLLCGLSKRMDEVLSVVQKDTFENGNVRIWKDGDTEVYLPGADNDVVFIFTHFLKHFYKGGLGLRQICDWCRLLYCYRNSLDMALLNRRLQDMGLMSEWRAFGAFAIGYLGMPVETMPLCDLRGKKEDARWRRKAERIKVFIMMSGNFGHSRDTSYYSKYPYVIRKLYSFGRRIGDTFRHSLIFPLDSIRFLPSIVVNGLKSAARGE